MSDTGFESILRTAHLFPRDEVVRYARVWLRREGSDFLELAPSQVGALRAAVAGSGTAKGFDGSVETFLADTGKRGSKTANPWRLETGGASLADRLRRALGSVAESVCGNQHDPANEAFARVCDRLNGAGEATKAQEARDLGIRKEFLDALARFHQAQRYYPFALQGDEENEEERNYDGFPSIE